MSLELPLDTLALTWTLIAMTGPVFKFASFKLMPGERLLLDGGSPVKIGNRAFDILSLLVSCAGQVVRKDQLISAVWPDVTVEDGNLKVHIASLRKAIGDGRPGARYINTIPGRGYSFIAPVSTSSANLTSKPTISTNSSPVRRALPRQPNRIVGRQEAIRDTTAQLLKNRFVSIVGAGGIGKTTVAVAVCEQIQPGFDGPIHFFDLGSLNESSLITPTLFSEFGVSPQSADPVADLISRLKGQLTLIVFDCCERLVDVVAPLAERILSECSLVHVLVTSREVLGVVGEKIYRLPPLTLPPQDSAIDLAMIMQYPAVELFVDRASHNGSTIVVSEAEASSIVEICRKLDGNPLAIELAAGRVTSYGINGVASLLKDRFGLLTNGRPGALPRHQTLIAALDWSYEVLSDEERTVLRRLSVLVGPFSLSAALAVVGEMGAAAATEVIGHLVRKSLVNADLRGEAPSYRLLDTTRDYGLRKLVEAGTFNPTAERHARHFTELLEADEARFVARLTTDHGIDLIRHVANVRAALQWAFSSEGNPAVAIPLAAYSGRLFLEISSLAECQSWAERALSLLDSPNAGRRRAMMLHMSAGVAITFTKGNTEDARGALSSALKLAEELDEPAYQLYLLEILNAFNLRTAEFQGAESLAIRGETVIATLTARTGLPIANAMVCSALVTAGHPDALDRTRIELAKAPAGNASYMRPFGIDRRNITLVNYMRALWLAGYPDKAMAQVLQTIEDAKARDHSLSFCLAVHWAILSTFWAGDLTLAERRIAALLDRARRSSLTSYVYLGAAWEGVLLLKHGLAQSSIDKIRDSVEKLQRSNHHMMTSVFLIYLAEAHMRTGSYAESLVEIDKAIQLIERRGDLVYLSEAMRVKADILSLGRDKATEKIYLRSLGIARRQRALSWELRTATSLANFWTADSRVREAYGLLETVYSRFDEGFDTADLRQARLLLDSLRPFARSISTPADLKNKPS